MAEEQTGKADETAARHNRLVKIELDEAVTPRRSAEAEGRRAGGRGGPGGGVIAPSPLGKFFFSDNTLFVVSFSSPL